jgi:SP family sugar:H+ symporter-like MFS transporter
MGIQNSYVTQMIPCGVNFASTFLGLYVVEHFGRFRSLIFGAFWMFVCFFIFASVGHFSLDRANPQATPHAGKAMIVFACLFILGFATVSSLMFVSYTGLSRDDEKGLTTLRLETDS